jgi:hypothetical protein
LGEVAADEFLITVGCDGVARSVESTIMKESWREWLMWEGRTARGRAPGIGLRGGDEY